MTNAIGMIETKGYVAAMAAADAMVKAADRNARFTPEAEGLMEEFASKLQLAVPPEAVTSMMRYKGRPDVCPGGCDGFLVGLADGAVMQWNAARDGAGGCAGLFALPGFDLSSSGCAFPLASFLKRSGR